MKSDRKAYGPIGSALKIGARLAQRPKTQHLPSLQLDANTPSKSERVERGNDPYNTSGSFDRTKNWARIGKR